MIYWGNDIVALDDPGFQETDRLDKWLNKVCSPQESALILESDSLHMARWRFWSCKESAYKVLIKCGVKPFLSARRIEILPIGSLQARKMIFKANFENRVLFGCSILDDKWVYSICSNLPLDRTKYETAVIKASEKEASHQIRTQVKRHIKMKHGIEVRRIYQGKHNVPVIECQDPCTKIDLSLSHHAPYSAYLYALCLIT